MQGAQMEYDSHAQNEMMRFLDVETDHMDDNIGDLDLSEDGSSSVASSTEVSFDALDFAGNESTHMGNLDDYNWAGPAQDLRPTGHNDMMASNMSSLAPMPMTFETSPSPAPSVPSDVTKHMQELIARIHFGATAEARSLVLPEREDFGNPMDTNYEYKIAVDDFPERSRVETQIKCRLSLSHALSGEPVADHLLHLPADTIARPRFQLMDESQLRTDPALASSMLWLSVDAVNQDVPEERVLMCPKCLARERKRAFRKKAMDPHEETYWNDQQARRVIIFNCKEVVPIDNDGQVELPLRIACYCRHHAAKNGYRLVFVLRNTDGKILGRTVSSKVFITDNHKEQRKAAGLTHSAPHSTSQTSLASTSASASASATSSGVESSSELYPVARAMRRQSSSSSLSMSNHPYMRPQHSRQPSQTSFQQFPSTNLQMQLKQSKYAPSWISDAAGANDPINATTLPHQTPQQSQPQQLAQQPQIATVFRAIPPSGSVRGGVEVTLLGQNFRPNLVAMFGEAPAVSTQCWSDSTIIAHLPASNQTGPVPVTFQGQATGITGIPPTMFTYVNDGEDKLKEIALQMIGYKMTGKIEDAGDIAQRIVVKDEGEHRGGGSDMSNGHSVKSSQTTPQINTQSAEQFALWVLRNIGKIAPERFANVNLRNTEGQSMMHLASMLGYASVVRALIVKGGYVDIQDVSGLTPLHFAVLFGNRNITRVLLQADADPFHRTLNGQTALDIADPTVSDLLPRDQRSWYSELNRRGSSSSLASLVLEWNREEGIAGDVDSGNDSCNGLSRNPSDSNVNMLSPEQTDVESSLDDSLADDESDNEASAADRLPSPPSYSKLFPSPLNRQGDVRRPSHKGRRAFVERRRGARQMPVIDIEISSSEQSSDERDESQEHALFDNAPEIEGASTILTENGVDPITRMVTQKSRTRSKSVLEIYNDKMLFTFWVPLWVITFASIVAIYVAQKSGSSSDPFATRIADFASRCTTATMNRILPMAQRMQQQQQPS